MTGAVLLTALLGVYVGARLYVEVRAVRTLTRPLPPPAAAVPRSICVDCDDRRATTSAGRCVDCGSSATFVPGTRRLPTSVEQAIDRKARNAQVVRGALARLAHASKAADAAATRSAS